MRLKKRSFWEAVLSGARAIIVKLYYGDRLRIALPCLIGRRCNIFILGRGLIRFGRRCSLADSVTLEANEGTIEIGDRTTINAYSRVIAHSRVKIGKRCAIAQFVAVIDHDHASSLDGLGPGGYISSDIVIGDDVWIGDKATVLRGVIIGNNAVVGAGAVVNCNVPDDSVAVGVPCRIIRRRRSDQPDEAVLNPED